MVLTSKLASNTKEDVLYPFELSYTPDKFHKKAENELFETPERKLSALKELREYISSEKDFSCRTTDEFLIQFLRARKYSVSKSFSLLKKCMHFKTKNQRIFTGMEYEILVKLIKSKTLSFLPQRCADGCAVIAVHLNNWEPSEVSIHDLSRAIVLYLFHSITDPVTQINGYKVLLDVKSNPWKHLRYITPQYMYLLYSGTQECFPGRFKGIHVVNMSLTFKAAWTIIQPFLSEKLKKRIILHYSNDTILNHFPESIVPVEFGGQVKDYDTSSWLKSSLQEEHLAKLAF